MLEHGLSILDLGESPIRTTIYLHSAHGTDVTHLCYMEHTLSTLIWYANFSRLLSARLLLALGIGEDKTTRFSAHCGLSGGTRCKKNGP